METPISVGATAPDFVLPLTPGEAPLRLADYRQEKTVVLLFFPLAFSAVCTDELRGVAENYSAWRELGAEIVGISVDSPFANQRFAREVDAPFPIVSDFNKETSSHYGVLHDDYFGLRGVSRRSAFVIDREGKVTFAWVAESDEPPDLDIVMRAAGQATTNP